MLNNDEEFIISAIECLNQYLIRDGHYDGYIYFRDEWQPLIIATVPACIYILVEFLTEDTDPALFEIHADWENDSSEELIEDDTIVAVVVGDKEGDLPKNAIVIWRDNSLPHS